MAPNTTASAALLIAAVVYITTSIKLVEAVPGCSEHITVYNAQHLHELAEGVFEVYMSADEEAELLGSEYTALYSHSTRAFAARAQLHSAPPRPTSKHTRWLAEHVPSFVLKLSCRPLLGKAGSSWRGAQAWAEAAVSLVGRSMLNMSAPVLPCVGTAAVIVDATSAQALPQQCVQAAVDEAGNTL